MAFYTYIVASQRNGTLYTGSTDDLGKRVWEHREKLRAGFTAKYGVSALVWFEQHASRDAAFQRERRIKKVEPRLETGPDRAVQPRLAGPLRRVGAALKKPGSPPPRG